MKPLYVASRASLLTRPNMWKFLRREGWNIISTWIDECGPEETKDFTALWFRIQGEIQASCGLILYAETEDFPLKGAYVEVGMALAYGKPVAVVLPGVEIELPHVRPVGSWINHPQVRVFQSVFVARDWIYAGADWQEPLTGSGVIKSVGPLRVAEILQANEPVISPGSKLSGPYKP